MTIQLFANNAKTTLAAPITASQTSISVAPGTGALFPSPAAGQAFKVTLVSASSATTFEICLCTARTGDVLTVTRAQEGTSGQPFILGDVVGNFDTKGVMDDLVQSPQLQTQYYQYGVAAGTANALTATIPSAITALTDGMYFTIKAAAANTGTATLNITLGSTITGVKSIVKGNNSPLIAGDIPASGYPLQINYSATFDAYVLANPATGIFVSSVPVGAIAQFPCTTAPSGYLICAGQLISRATYAALWAFAQASGNLSASDAAWVQGKFSPGDGSTTFRLPQYGGYFLRSLDNGNGIDPARAIGTVQAGQNVSHTHTASVTDPGHNHAGTFIGSTSYLLGYASGGSQQPAGSFSATNDRTTGISVSNANQGGSEARPINVSVLTCIKF